MIQILVGKRAYISEEPQPHSSGGKHLKWAVILGNFLPITVNTFHKNLNFFSFFLIMNMQKRLETKLSSITWLKTCLMFFIYCSAKIL